LAQSGIAYIVWLHLYTTQEQFYSLILCVYKNMFMHVAASVYYLNECCVLYNTWRQ